MKRLKMTKEIFLSVLMTEAESRLQSPNPYNYGSQFDTQSRYSLIKEYLDRIERADNKHKNRLRLECLYRLSLL